MNSKKGNKNDLNILCADLVNPNLKKKVIVVMSVKLPPLPPPVSEKVSHNKYKPIGRIICVAIHENMPIYQTFREVFNLEVS